MVGDELAVAFPPGTDVLALARAWFPEAELIEEAMPTGRRPIGARFGPRTTTAVPTPVRRRLRLPSGAELCGPQESALHVSVPRGMADVYLVESTGADAVLSAWLVAAARRAGGAVVAADGETISPPSDEVVGLTLHNSRRIAADSALVQARTVAPMMREVRASEDAYALALDTPYDGTVLLRARTDVERPPSLLSPDGEPDSRYVLQLTWRAPGPAAESPRSTVGRIARDRVVPLVARLALVLQSVAGGTVVDPHGFIVGAEELRSRASR